MFFFLPGEQYFGEKVERRKIFMTNLALETFAESNACLN